MKRFSALLLALALLAALPACADGSGTSAAASADPAEQARQEFQYALNDFLAAQEELDRAAEEARALLDVEEELAGPDLVERLEAQLNGAEPFLSLPAPEAADGAPEEVLAQAQALREETDRMWELGDSIRYAMEELGSSREAQAEEKRMEAVRAEPVLTGTAETANGYRAEYTISVTRWLRASDAQSLQPAWEGVGGKDGYPAVSQFHSTTNDGFSEANAAVAFGTVSFRNVTEGFDITEDNPISFAVPISVAFDKKFGINSPKLYIQYTEPKTLSFKDYPSIVPLMKKNDWGPVAFMLIVPNAFTPNDPEGAVLDTLEFSAGYGQSFTIAPSW